MAVLIDPEALDTLPDREYRSGLWEIVKAGIIRDRTLFDFLASDCAAVLARHPHAVERIIHDSVRMKAEVVSSDEREGDLRRILNLGHTFGHALETETGYSRFLHAKR
jgi:3-dehydroquinate synthase